MTASPELFGDPTAFYIRFWLRAGCSQEPFLPQETEAHVQNHGWLWHQWMAAWCLVDRGWSVRVHCSTPEKVQIQRQTTSCCKAKQSISDAHILKPQITPFFPESHSPVTRPERPQPIQNRPNEGSVHIAMGSAHTHRGHLELAHPSAASCTIVTDGAAGRVQTLLDTTRHLASKTRMHWAVLEPPTSNSAPTRQCKLH